MRRLLRVLFIGSVIAVIAREIMRRRATGGAGERGAPLRPLRSFISHRLDPLVVRLGLGGGRHSPWALVENVGRVSGHVYRTPVTPLPFDGGFEIPLAFGADVDWARNVLAAGRARLQLHDSIVEVDRPEIVEAAEARSLTPTVRRFATAQGYRYLRLHTVATMPGAFSHLDGHAVAATAGEPVPVVAEPPMGIHLGQGPAVPAAEPELVGTATG